MLWLMDSQTLLISQVLLLSMGDGGLAMTGFQPSFHLLLDSDFDLNDIYSLYQVHGVTQAFGGVAVEKFIYLIRHNIKTVDFDKMKNI